jgi:arylsulfatase A-like enzyme
LFLWVAYSVPHHPLSESEAWTKRYAGKIEDPWRRQFAGAVTHMDAAIGRLVETVAKTGRTERTLILFTSDNGGQQDYASANEYGGRYERHTVLGDNRPLRGWKGGLYEGGIRVPALASWPGRLEPREVTDPIRIIDWLPTLVRVAGIHPSPDWGIEGRDVWPLLTGSGAGAVPAPNFYWNTGSAQAVRSGPWKLIVRGGKAPQVELFDVVADPHEKEDRAASQPEVVQRLRAELERQRALDGARP